MSSANIEVYCLVTYVTFINTGRILDWDNIPKNDGKISLDYSVENDKPFLFVLIYCFQIASAWSLT